MTSEAEFVLSACAWSTAAPTVPPQWALWVRPSPGVAPSHAGTSNRGPRVLGGSASGSSQTAQRPAMIAESE